ncbi:MAG: hypothetical protein LQ350_006432 [Teloschistes chrysophthalmus]|nr:MAG: hypothetical protein LQ350_006432 [Niorma chrysophthalma]
MRPTTDSFLGSLIFRKPSSGYVCPNCIVRNALRRARQRQPSTHRFQPSARRLLSTISSVTAVNVKKDLPPAFRGLYDALGVLKREAAVYANLSQIQLAQRGLESENGITRIAALGGIDGHQTRRLVRILLADPLTPEPEWEKQLLGLDDGDGRALLLRYAEKFDVDQRHPLVRTLFVPSPVLQNHRLEILIQAAGEQSEDGNGEAHMYLVPGLESPISFGGSYQTITYPVHKALVLAQGLKSTRALLSPSPGKEAGAGEEMVMAVVNTPWSSLSPAFEPLHPIKAINLDRAEEAIATFRKSLDNSFSYEHEWFDSGLPQLFTWLIEGTESLPGIVKPTIRRLIETLITNIEEAIQREEKSVMKAQASTIVPQATRDKMNAYLTNWAEAAHLELRDELDRAFSSKQWRKLAWWKLLWRVDDVTAVTSDILQRSWLVDADRGILYLAGRIEEAGLLPPHQRRRFHRK